MNSRPFADARLSSQIRFAALFGCLLVAAPLAAHAGAAHSKSSSSHGFSLDDRGGRFSWGLLDPADGTTMSDTNGDDWQEIQRLMRDEDLPVFWFRREGRNYIVRDREVVARATEIAEPLSELGRKQGALGAKQGALGEKQSKIGEKQASIGARQARLAARLSGLANFGSSDDHRAAARERRELEAALDELSDQQTELGREQAPLGRLQSELGREQAVLGREQARLSKEVNEQIRRLADETVKSGKAEPTRRRRSS